MPCELPEPALTVFDSLASFQKRNFQLGIDGGEAVEGGQHMQGPLPDIAW